MTKTGPRIALYSHDTVGMGHTRRNLRIAETLSRRFPLASILLVAGARESARFDLPPRVDMLTLPSLQKTATGGYGPRRLASSSERIRSLRSSTIRAAIAAFEPDLFVVDKIPRGALRELDPVLEALRAGGGTRCVLGLRDVLDEPEAVRREWLRDEWEEAIERYYDAIWIYGDPGVYDLIEDCALSSAVAAKSSYTGYLSGHELSAAPGSAGWFDDRGDRLALCQLGGGEDGARLALAFADAELPSDMSGMIVTGPYMPAPQRHILEQRAAGRARLQVVDFVDGAAALLQRADRVVSMGGYNTLTEILTHRASSLVVPRSTPRQEQLIRARRFSSLGLVDALHPDRLTPAALTEWLWQDEVAPRKGHRMVDMSGLDRLPDLVAGLLASKLELPRELVTVSGEDAEVRSCA